MRQRAVAVTVVLAVVVPAVSRAETLEEAQKKISAQQAKYKTLQYKSRSKMDMDTPQMKMKQTTEGTMEVARKGDTWLSRIESKSTGTTKVGDNAEEKSDSTVLMIGDGKTNYTLTEQGGQKTAMKKSVDRKLQVNPLDAAALFKQQEKDFDLKLLPDADVDGKACYVIEMKAKKAESSPMSTRMVISYRKDNGIAVKTQSFSDAGKEVMVSTVSDIKIDEEIKPERFVFKAPAGVEVMDLDKAGEPTETADKEQPKAETEKQPEEKPKAAEKEQPKTQEKPKKNDAVGGLLKGILKK